MFSYAVPVSDKCHQNDVILIITLPIARRVGVILSKSEMRNESTIVFLSLYFCVKRIKKGAIQSCNKRPTIDGLSAN